jgi:hypothetical protein
MDGDEREIFNFLKSYGQEWINAREICRRASTKRRFNDDNSWAKPILQRMMDRHVLEGDEMGRYRIKPIKKGKGPWVSPDIEKILRESGVKVDAGRADAAAEEAADEHYEQL